MTAPFDEADEADRRTIWLRAGAFIHDPTALSGLEARVDERAVPVSGVPFDTAKTTGERVDCALCGRSRNHNKGFVVTFADERRAIIGKDCGEDKLFEAGAWQTMVAGAEARKRKAVYDARSAPALASIDRVLPLLDDCVDAVGLIDTLLEETAEELPDLYDGMDTAARHGGMLIRTVDKRVAVVGPDGEPREVWQSERRTYVALPSAAPFAPGGLSARTHSIARELIKTRGKLDSDTLTLGDQAAAAQALRGLRQTLRELADEAERCRVFLDRAFWEAVAKWGKADTDRRGNYRVTKRRIRHSSEDYEFGEVILPDAEAYSLAPFDLAHKAWPIL